jgi:hypothetical protein
VSFPLRHRQLIHGASGNDQGHRYGKPFANPPEKCPASTMDLCGGSGCILCHLPFDSHTFRSAGSPADVRRYGAGVCRIPRSASGRHTQPFVWPLPVLASVTLKKVLDLRAGDLSAEASPVDIEAVVIGGQ